tara:strand:+ start:1955 stop:2113 length:159 start_codon:yes stop_codon:yes gene_type:complete
MILYTEEQFNDTYKEYRYHHMHKRCEYLSAEDFREMFEALMKITYRYEVDDE